jgi:hypothetical protein
MQQIFDALFQTAFRIGHEYGPPLVLAVLAFVAGGLVLRVIYRLRRPRGPR